MWGHSLSQSTGHSCGPGDVWDMDLDNLRLTLECLQGLQAVQWDDEQDMILVQQCSRIPNGSGYLAVKVHLQTTGKHQGEELKNSLNFTGR